MTSADPASELLARLELFATAFQKSPLFLSVADLTNDHYLEVNDTFCQAVGYPREEIVGRSAVELGLITPEGRDRLAREFMEMTAAARKYPIEFEIRCRDGTALTCRYWGELVQTAAGLRVVAAAENVTEFKNEQRAREAALSLQDAALQRSNERFALAMDAVTEGLWDWDLGTDTSYFSPGTHRMLGLPLGGLETSGLAWLARVHPDDRPALEAAIRECAAGQGAGFESEFRLRTHSGAWRWVLSRGRRVGAHRVLATHVDVTERKRLQQGLAQNDRLASLGMLSAGVGHEINNPLAYVMANLELMLVQLGTQKDLAPAFVEDLVGLTKNALEGSERVRRISRTLSTFSRVETSELQAVDVNHALDEATRMADVELRYRATVTREFGDLPPVRASHLELVQVFLNIIVNAAQAVDDGRADHRITLRSWAADGHVFAEVRDTGPGIAQEHLRRVFEPFFTTKPAGVGAGLGLAISKRILSGCGGDIEIDSEVGKGTRVVVKLVEHRVPGSAAAPVPARRAPQRGVRRRVLIVDDEPAWRRALARLLKPYHDVVAAADGREAQERLAADQGFDVILCDLMMPELSGMELHEWLATHQPALAERVVFMSGGAFTAGAMAYLSRVHNVRLEKPFDLPRLLAVLDDLAERLGPHA